MVKVKTETPGIQGIKNQAINLRDRQPSRPSILDGIQKVRVESGQDPIDLINELMKDPNVIYAEPINRYQLLYVPSDPANATNQAYLEQIKAYDAWDITRGDDDITIAIIDTGLDLDHEDLIGSLWTNDADPIDGIDNDLNGYTDDFHGYDFADGDSNPDADGSTHGARVGGIAGATTDNSIGISGVGFNTKIAALKGFTTVGELGVNLFEGIMYAADNGMQIMNLSFGALTSPLQSEQDIINYAVLERDVVVVAASGNTDIDGKFYPASYDNVISAGSVEFDDTRSGFSTYNYSVDIMAPGASIYSTHSGDAYGSDSGTSYSSPMVAAAAALIRDRFPHLNAQQVMERVRVTADDIYGVGSNATYDGKLGLGRLNVLSAVSASNPKSIRITAFEPITPFGSSLFFGDTVTVGADLKNFLSQVNDAQITISSPDNNFTVIENTLFTGPLSTLEEDTLIFEIVLESTLAPETPIAIRLDYNDGAYNDFQFLETETSPDYFHFGDDLQLTIAGNGNLGFADASFFNGSGLTLNGSSILDYIGVMLATSSSSVSDNIISDYSAQSREQDFSDFSYFKLYDHPVADHFSYSEFEDPIHSVIFEQSAFAMQNEPYLILRYRLINNAASAISNLHFGYYADFDLTNALENKAEFDLAGNYILTKDLTETLFSGSKVLSDGLSRYSALDVDNQNGNGFDVQNAFTDANKYDFLVNQQIVSAGDLGNGNDVSTLNGTTITLLDAFSDTTLFVILATGNSKIDLENNFSIAESKINEVVQNPRILETTFSCDGSQVTLDPESGTNYRFYEDPEATILLHEGTSFTTGTIDQDTSFYVRNIDNAYPSAIFQHQVKLITEVSDFTIEPDTLYLDHATNVVSFTDQSFDANLWNWDFGNGNTSNIQNPSLSFNEVGNYSISLYIENIHGCSDTQIKPLVVANRPASPVFSDFTTCPGESIALSDPSADYLKVYSEQEATSPEVTGNDLMLAFDQDTTLFVSGVYSQFESLKTAVIVDVDELDIDFTIVVDTNSTAHQIVAHTTSQEPIKEWFVNGVSRGFGSQITVDSNVGTAVVRLSVENSSGCQLESQQTFEFSTSPLPSQQDIVFCESDSKVLSPENGTIFGFYGDASLTSLIKKGTQLETDGHTQVFVVGLDDGLPGTPIEVNITEESFNVVISTTIEEVSGLQKVSLTAEAEGIQQYNWLVDGELVETSSNPTLFFGNDRFEVVLEASNENGCVGMDTVNLDFAPLGSEVESDLTIYPNPASRFLEVRSNEPIHELTIMSLSGTEVFQILEVPEKIDLSSTPGGVYIVRLATDSGFTSQKLVIRQ